MKSPSLPSLHLASSGHWRVLARRLAHAARSPADAKRNAGPKGHSFDDSRHPVFAIANRIAIFFLAMSAVALLALVTDTFLTRA